MSNPVAAFTGPGQGSGSASLTGRQKAALLCIQLGTEWSSKALKFLRDEEIEKLTVEIAQARRAPVDTLNDIIQEFVEQALAEKYTQGGGIDYARELLNRALGPERAKEILQRLTTNLRKRPFDSIRAADPAQIAGYLQNEHPQTIAVVLAHLTPLQAKGVMESLPPERQADLIRRVSALSRTSPDMLREVEKVLERKLSSVSAQEEAVAPVGGINWAVAVLNSMDRTSERAVVEALTISEPELAAEIQELMFVFEDIVKLNDRTIQRILREVDMNRDLPLALKAAKQDVWDKVVRNISARAAQALRESVEYLGPVRIRDVEEAQTRIVTLIRSLEERDEIQISRGGDDEFI